MVFAKKDFTTHKNTNTMNTQHTPEPWALSRQVEDTISPVNIISGKVEIAIIAAYEFRGASVEEAQANAERIVVCVNACKGVSNEWLQENGVQERIDEIRSLKLKIAELEAQLIKTTTL